MSNVIFFASALTRPLSGHYISSEMGYDDTGKQREFGALSGTAPLSDFVKSGRDLARRRPPP